MSDGQCGYIRGFLPDQGNQGKFKEFSLKQKITGENQGKNLKLLV